MISIQKITLVILGLTLTSHTWAAKPSFSSYNQIVDKLQRHRDGRFRGYKRPKRSWAGPVHAGLGFSQVAFQSASSSSDTSSLDHRGLFVGLGIGLGQSRWALEGNFKNLGESLGKTQTHRLREFNLLAFFTTPLKKWSLKTGAGLDFRLLSRENQTSGSRQSDLTAGMLIVVGASRFISKTLSLGMDINYKNAFSQTTLDHRSFDFSLRADIHF